MNNFILMAEIIEDPQLRYTSDNQTPITEMLVQFPGLRAEDPPGTLKVIGWGNLAQEMQERYHQGDRVVVEGRLGMNTIERPEGFREKRAELTAQRIHPWGSDIEMGSAPTSSGQATPPPPPRPAPRSPVTATTASPSGIPAAPASFDEPDYDDIPF